MDTANPSPYGGAPSWFLIWRGGVGSFRFLGSCCRFFGDFPSGSSCGWGRECTTPDRHKKDLGAVGSPDLSPGSGLDGQTGYASGRGGPVVVKFRCFCDGGACCQDQQSSLTTA